MIAETTPVEAKIQRVERPLNPTPPNPITLSLKIPNPKPQIPKNLSPSFPILITVSESLIRAIWILAKGKHIS